MQRASNPYVDATVFIVALFGALALWFGFVYLLWKYA